MHNVTKEFLEQRYTRDGLTMQEIANESGHSYKFIFYTMKKLGIPSRRSWRDLTGQVFDYLTVLARDHEKSSQQNAKSFWICKCKCGTVRSFRGRGLLTGKAKSCGCRSMIRYGGISGLYWSSLRWGAKKRNFKFDITIEQAWELFQAQESKCALSGRNLSLTFAEQTASLDRKDSSLHYTIDNIQWIHKDINLMKNYFDENYFKQTCKEIANYTTRPIAS